MKIPALFKTVVLSFFAAWLFFAQQDAAVARPIIYFTGVPSKLEIGNEFILSIYVDDFADLWGLAFEVKFDEGFNILEILDGDADEDEYVGAPGINLNTLADFDQEFVDKLPAEAGIARYNSRIKWKGIQLNEAIPSGPLLVAQIAFRVLSNGETQISFGEADSKWDLNQVVSGSNPDYQSDTLQIINLTLKTNGEQIPASFELFEPENTVLSPKNQDSLFDSLDLRYYLSSNAKVYLYVENEDRLAVRTLIDGQMHNINTSGVTGTVAFDGKNDAGEWLLNGDYTVYLHTGNTGFAKKVKIRIDNGAPKIGRFFSRRHISPNADASNDYLSASLSLDEPGNCDIDVQDGAGNPVLTVADGEPYSSRGGSFYWMGEDEAGDTVEDGAYDIAIQCTDQAGNVSPTAKERVYVDTQPIVLGEPTPDPSAPTQSPTISAKAYDYEGVGPDYFKSTVSIDYATATLFDDLDNITLSESTSNLDWGWHNARMRVYDLAGNLTVRNWEFVLDNTPPVLSNATQSHQTVNPADALFTVSFDVNERTKLIQENILKDGRSVFYADYADNASGSQFLDWDGVWNVGGSGIHEGNYSWKVTARDFAGNEADISGNVIVDQSPPLFSAVAVEPADLRFSPPQLQTATFTFTLNEWATGTVDVLSATGTVVSSFGAYDTDVDGAAIEAVWGSSGNPADVESGVYTFRATAKDAAGNGTTLQLESQKVTVDSASPTFAYRYPVPNTDTNSLSFDISVIALDEGGAQSGINPDSIYLIFDGEDKNAQAVWDEESNVLLYSASVSAINNHTATAAIGDLVGNRATTAWSFTIDSVDPTEAEITNIFSAVNTEQGMMETVLSPPTANMPVSGENVRISVKAEDRGTGVQKVSLYVDDGAGQVLIDDTTPTADTKKGNFPFAWDTTELDGGDPKYPDGIYTLTAKVEDYLGNYKEGVATVAVDNSAPSVTSIIPENGGYFSIGGNSTQQDMAVALAATDTSPFTWSLEIAATDTYDISTWDPDVVMTATATVAAGGGYESAALLTWNGYIEGQGWAPDGTYLYAVRATDTWGYATMAATGILTIDSDVPTLSYVLPADDHKGAGSIGFSVEATDTSTLIDQVEMVRYLKNANAPNNQSASLTKGSTDTWTLDWVTDQDAPYADDGKYGWNFTGYDQAGNYAETAERDLLVGNAPVKITNIKSDPDAFSPHGNSGAATWSIEFALTRSSDVDVEWLMAIGRDIGGWATDVQYPTDSSFSASYQGDYATGPIEWNEEVQESTIDDGLYEYRIWAEKQTTPTVASLATGEILVDSTAPVISAATATPDFFTPDGNGASDTTTIGATITEVNPFSYTLEIACNATGSSLCAAEYGAGELLWATAATITPSATDTYISYVWDGLTNATAPGSLVPDGMYRYTFAATDTAGNWATHTEGIVAKDNPPVPLMVDGWSAFSPDSDGSKDTVDIVFSANEEAYLDFALYEFSTDTLVTTFATDQHYATAGASASFNWDGTDDQSQTVSDGIYRLKMTGRDYYSERPNGEEVVNPIEPQWGHVVVDTEDPVVTAYYPYEFATDKYEFTNRLPKIKAWITDNLSGFGETAAKAEPEISFEVDPASTALSANVYKIFDRQETTNSIVSMRAWSRPTDPLAIGPHDYVVYATDTAGNKGEMDLTRFISIEPLADDFSDATDSQEFWNPIISTSQGSTGSVTFANGKMNIDHTNKVESQIGLDIYGIINPAAGVFDISRQEAIFEVDGITTSGTGNWFGPWIGFLGIENGEIAQNVGIAINDNQVWPFIEDSKEGHIIDFIPRGTVTEPVDLKIHYEEGELKFYANDALIVSANVELNNVLPGVTAASGFDTDFFEGSESMVSVEMEEATSTLSRPILNGIEIENVQRATSTEILYATESFVLTATGTPWQTTVQGHMYNVYRMLEPESKFLTDAGIQLQAPIDMPETNEGSGVYQSDPMPADFYLDQEGRETNLYVEYCSNVDMDKLFLPEVDVVAGNLDAGDLLFLTTKAVDDVSMFNVTETLENYPYLKVGERYRIFAQASTSPIHIEAYLVNLDTFNDVLATDGPYQAIEDATIDGPLTMVKTALGEYESVVTFTSSVDASAATATTILPVVRYGARRMELVVGSNTLTVGEPDIREVTLANADRAAAGDLARGEKARVEARGKTGLSLDAYLIDSATVQSGPIFELYSGGFAESPADSGLYAATFTVDRLFDDSGLDIVALVGAGRLSGSTGTYEYSTDTLDILPEDPAPGPPENLVILSSMETAPASGSDVTVEMTWSPPATSVEGSSAADVAGYNIYRLIRDAATNSFSVAQGSPSPSLTEDSTDTYSLAATCWSYKGVDYNDTSMAAGGAGWFSTGSRNLTALPISSSQLIKAGEPVYAYLVDLTLTDTLYTVGTWQGTVYAQENRSEIEKWIERLVDEDIASAGLIAGSAKIFEPDGNGEFSALSPPPVYPVFSLKKANDNLATGTLYVDTYDLDDTGDVLQSYFMAAVDEGGKESAFSNIASLPLWSNSVATSTLSNSDFSYPTGYLEPGGSYRVDTSMEVAGTWSLFAYAVNFDSLKGGVSFASATLDGPISLVEDQATPGSYPAYSALPTLTDGSGAAAGLVTAAIEVLDREVEIVRSETLLRGGTPPIQMATLSNKDRDGKDYARVGEALLITSRANTGLSLEAKLVNPMNVATTTFGVPVAVGTVSLTETPAGSGLYEGEIGLSGSIDEASETATQTRAIVYDSLGAFSLKVPSQEILGISPQLIFSGGIEADFDWIRSGDSLSASCTVTNLETDAFDDVLITSSVLTPLGKNIYEQPSYHDFAAAQTVGGIAVDYGSIEVASGSYEVAVDVSLDGYRLFYATDSFKVIDEAFDGTLITDKYSYILGETMYATYTIQNVTAYDFASVSVEMRYVDLSSGAVIEVFELSDLLDFDSGEIATDTAEIQLPDPMGKDGDYRVEIVASLDEGRDDVAGGAVVRLSKPKILISGDPIPAACVQYQEVLFNFRIDNLTLDDVDMADVTGEVVPLSGDSSPIYAAFTEPVLDLKASGHQFKTGRFGPVIAVPGDYKVKIYYQEVSQTERSEAYETQLTVDACE